MQKNKLDKNLKTNLFSADTETVILALNTLKEKGNADYLPLLFDLLKSGPEEPVEKEIIYLLANLKKQEAVPVLIGALQSPKYISIRKKLTAACWQNGLNYQKDLPVFVDIVIKEDWETGFEAFTVIENMENLPDQGILKLQEIKIQHALTEAVDQKKYFLQEILSFIR